MHSPLVSPRAHSHPATSCSPRPASRLARCRRSALLLLAGALSLATARAQLLYWDANADTAGAGGPTPNGTWGTDLFWSTDPAGAMITAGWTGGATAIFAAGNDASGTYVVTLSSAQTAAGLVFEEGNVTLSGIAPDTNLTFTGSIDVAASATASISLPLAGAGGLTKQGSGTLTLPVTNSFSGTVNVSGGTLAFGSTGSAADLYLGAAPASFNPSAVTLADASTLSLSASIITLNGNRGVTLSGSGANLDAVAPAIFFIPTPIAGPGATLTKTGGGEVGFYTATNTFARLIIDQGNLRIGQSTFPGSDLSYGAVPAVFTPDAIIIRNGATNRVVGSTAVTISTNRGITLGTGGGVFRNDISPVSLTINSPITGPGGLRKEGGQAFTLNGERSYNGPTVINGGGTSLTTPVNTFAGPGTGTGSLQMNSGRLTLNNANAYSSVGVAGGRIDVNTNGALGTGTVTVSPTNNVTIVNATLLSPTNATLPNDFVLNAGTTLAGNPVIIDIAANSGRELVLSGKISGNAQWKKDNGGGTGTLVLGNSANDFTGTLTNFAGTVIAAADNALGAASGGTVINNASSLAFRGGIDYTALEPVSITGMGRLGFGAISNDSGNSSFAGPITMTGNSGFGGVPGATLTLHGAIGESGGAFAFAKLTPNTIRLTAANNYSGGTLISNGTLIAANTSGSATGPGPITIFPAGSLSGPGSVAGTVTVNGTLAPGASPGTMNTGSEIWNGGASYNWEVNDATGTQGADPGWDLANITGTLTINATPASKFNLNILSLTLANVAGAAANFSGATDFTWTILKTTGGISGFDAAAFNINTNGFVSPRDASGLFLVETANGGNDIVIRFVRTPLVVTPPADVTLACGGSVPLTVSATGTAPFTYQWRRNGTPLANGGNVSGATSATLTLNPASALNNGSYDVVVTNPYGSTTSAVAAVTFTDTTPPSIACPSDITVKVLTTNGSSVSFTPVAVDDCATPTVVCVPASGSTFLIGTNTVTCTASDGVNATHCTFLVNVYYQEATNKLVNTLIPDNDANGLASTLTVASPLGILTDLNVTLHITNGWNGDLYCYVTHSSGFSVLLNRVGRRTGDSLGYGDAGFNVTLDEEAANGDIHVYRATLFSGDHAMPLAGMLTNAWRPDGRATSPTNVLDTDVRTALLSSFNGVNPNGDWTLFVADIESGDQSTLVSWGLELCGILPIPASILTQPPSQTLECSSNLTLTVTTTGTGPLTNRWYKDGMAIAAATNLALALNDAHPAASGTYTFVVCNMANCATSAPIVIGVIDTLPPVISTCASNQTVCPDSMSQFAVPNVLPQVVAVDGCSAVTLSQIPLAGTMVGPGTHAITISATDGSNLTATCMATLVVQTNTTATALTPLALCPGSPAMFSTTADGTGPFSYQWFRNDVAILNATNSTYTIPSVLNADAGAFCVVVSGACSSVTNCAGLTVFNNVSATALLSVTNGCPGSPVLFAALASGTGPITYQWTRAGTNIPGANGFSYFIPSPTTEDNGTYCVIVSGLCTSVTNCATLTVATPPVISAQPQNQIRPMGNSATFSVTATGPSDPATLGYQWFTNGVAAAGATAANFTLSGLTLGQNGWTFQVVASNCAGMVTSSVAVLTVEAQAGIAFDFNTPGQWTNTPYAMAMNNFINTALPAIPFEVSTGGVGVATGGGALDLTINNGTANSSTLLPLSYDFSLPNKTLTVSAMVRVKVPTSNNRNTQIGFVTATNADLDNSAGRAYMTVILQSTAQPAPTYELRQGTKPNGANTFFEGNAVSASLATSTWHRVTATFQNTTLATAGTYQVSATVQSFGADGLTAGGTTHSMGPVSITNVDVTASSRLFFVLRGIENTGLDYWDNVYVHTASGAVFFVQDPPSQSVAHGRPLKFQALVDGDGPYAYQWQRSNSASGFVDLPGATAWNLFVPAAAASDNQAHYRVVANGPASSATSAAALVTVVPDALDVVSAGSVDGCVVGIRFDQAVDPISAANPANYLINGVAAAAARVYQSPTDLRAVVQEGTRVVVTPAAPLAGAFTVSVSGVQDVSGNAIGGTTMAAGTVSELKGEDVNPIVTAPTGQQFSFGDGQFEVSGGGADIWNQADSFRFVYKTVSGDFDVKARIPHVDVMRGTTKAGFNVRPSLDPLSPQVLAAVNPQPPARNFPEGTFEATYNVNAGSWGSTPALSYPNVWLRMRRVGNTFLRYSSTNGVNWQLDGQLSPNPALPSDVLLGLAVCAAANGNLATAWFENYGDFAGYPGAVIAIVQQPVNVTTNAGSAALLTAVATLTGGPATGELAYLWQRSDGIGGWTNMPTAGATNEVLNTGALTGADNGAQYRVIVMAPGATSVTSAVATVTVNDAAAPTVAAAIIPAGAVAQILITYSEPMGASAVNAANYSVTNGPGASLGVASAVFLHGDPRTVLLTTMNPMLAGTYGVRISGVQDPGGNNLNPNPTLRLLSQAGNAPQLGPIVVQFYGSLTNGSSINDLTNNVTGGGPGQKFASDNPDMTFYSNVFGINPVAGNFPGTLDHYGVRMYTYFVPPTNGVYKFYVRADDYAQFLMNTNAVGSTNRAGAVLQVAVTANAQTYAAVRSVTNTLVGGQRYYMELRFKDSTGGDGGTVALRVGTDTGIPGQGEVLPGSLCAFPDAIAKPTPAVVELYTGMVTLNSLGVNDVGAAFGNGGHPDLIDATNTAAFIARVPNVAGYARYFGFNTNLVQINVTFDNYLGRLYALFVAPSNGLYKFWVRSDDSVELWMNTNANPALSPMPDGISLLGLVNDFYDANYRLIAQNVALTGGQRYWLEGRWREGTGGDGMTVAVRAQDNFTLPANTEVMAPGLLEFPAANDRVGPVDGTIAPLNPVVSQGQTISFQAVGIRGTPTYGFFWLKNGVQIAANSVNFVTQPLTMSDNGAVFTLVVTNGFSRVERSSTVTVLGDATPPSIVGAVGSQYQEFVVLTFSEPLDRTSADCLTNYRMDLGVRVYSATLDASRTRVTLRTSPQTPGVRYTVTVNGVKDASGAGNVIAANSTIGFTAWIAAGCGLYAEVFTNIAGSAVVNLIGDAKYVNNTPDGAYYTNRFGGGWFGNDTGFNNYGVRLSGFFSPYTNGLYRFYIRGDDGTQLFMNTNGPAASGRKLIARSDGANSGTFENGVGGSASAFLQLNADTLYYIEALMKEGGGGDHVEVAMRPIDATTLTPIGGLPGANVNELVAGGFFVNVGNPDTARLTVVQAPPASLNVVANNLVTLRGSAHASSFDRSQATCYQWQKYNGSGGFTNVPGAKGPTHSFYASLADNGNQYRMVASGPGTNAIFATTLNVAADTVGPLLISASSLNGTNIDLCFSEPIDRSSGTGEDTAQYQVNGGAVTVLSAYLRTNDDRTVVVNLASPVSGMFTVDAGVAGGMQDLAVNFSTSSATGMVQNVLAVDVGSPVAAGSSFSCAPDEIDVIAGGNDIWGTSDVGHLTLSPRTGNFDVRVRVESLSRPDAIAKAGLMVRESLDANSRALYCSLNPSQFQMASTDNPSGLSGRDLGEAGQRFATAQATAAWAARPESRAPVQQAAASAYLPAAVPNAWIRILREGNLFTAMRSYDGVNWLTYAQCPFSYGETVYVGLATTAHTATQQPGLVTVAQYRDLYLPAPPIILVQPVSQIVPTHAAVTFMVVATNPPPNLNPLTYQWSKNGINLAGATNHTLNIPNALPSAAGTYTVRVCNDGGNVTSDPATLVVGGPPVVTGEMLMATQNLALSISAGDLLANDSDPDLDALSIVAVSGVSPVTYASDFSAGVPLGLTVFGQAGPDVDSGGLLINPGAASAIGSAVLDELTPGRRVSAFTADFTLRVFNGSAEPADGFSFNFAPDLVLGTSGTAEDGVGTGFTLAVDNYRFYPYPQGGRANTSGLKIRYRGLNVIGVQIPTWNSPRFVPVSISVTAEGQCTVRVDGTNVFGTVTLPNYIPLAGRFGIYGRCGGQFESHAIDDLAVTVLTLDTSRDPVANPNAPTLVGSARIDGGVLHITDNANNLQGSYISPVITTVPFTEFRANFNVRIGGGTTRPADGISFSVGPDLPSTSWGEEGAGTYLNVCFDTWDNNGPDTAPAIDVKFGGIGDANVIATRSMNGQREGGRPPFNTILTDGGGQPVSLATDPPAPTSSVTFVPVSLVVRADGTMDLSYKGIVVFANLAIPGFYNTNGLRVGFGARTGGANDNHWVDDLAIHVTTAGSPETYADDFTSFNRYGTVTLTNGIVTYTPPTDACGPDAYYYLVSDGGTTSIARVDVVIKETVPAPPVISMCVPNQTYGLSNACVLDAPDLRGLLVASDNCCCLLYTQTPAPGTPLALGSHLFTFVAADTMGLSATCTATVVVQDVAPPQIACPTDFTVQCVGMTTPVTFVVTAMDVCTASPSLVCTPPSGFGFPVGSTTVVCATVDDSGNSNGCSFVVSALPYTTSFPVNAIIPDNNPNGLSSTKTVATEVGVVTDVNVRLTLSGGYNGDLYVYLVHGSGFSVLLNRSGRQAAAPLGYADSGFDVTLDDQATNDIHSYRFTLFGDHVTPLAGPLTNSWAPDGRATDPALVLDTDPRTELLASFNGVNPNGDWTLFLADVSPLDQTTLVSWGLEICGLPPIPPSLTLQPQGATVACSSNYTFTSAATGTAPLTNQWYFNGVLIPGATGPSLTLNAVSVFNAGNYTLVVSGMGGSITSAPAVLVVTDDPPVLTCPANITTECVTPTGTVVTFNATVTDICTAMITATCVPASGSLFPPGSTLVSCTATDDSTNTVGCSFTVNVVDTTPPAFCMNVPSLFPAGGTNDDFSGLEAASPSSNLLARLSGLDLQDFDDTITDAWLGHTFDNLPAYASQVRLRVRLRAVGGLPENDTIILGLVGPGGVLATPSWSRRFGSTPGDSGLLGLPWTAGKTNEFVLDLGELPNRVGPPTDLLPLIRQLRYLDVMVQDDSVVDYVVIEVTSCQCGPNIVLTAQPGDCTAVAAFPTPAFTDNCDLTTPTICSPPSGSAFPIGTTLVTCTATDDSGNVGSCAFSVTVNDQPALLNITQQGGNIVICWPVSCTAFILESTPSLAAPITWTPVGTSPVLNGNQFCVTLPNQPVNRFFRLRSL